MYLTSPTDIAFRIADFPVYWYGICIALGSLSGFALSYFVAKKYYKNLNADVLYDVMTFTILGGFLFARLYYCLLNFDFYCQNPLDILNFRQGGLSIQGGLLGGLLIGGWYAKSQKLQVLELADIITFGLLLAQSIGRWGNFFNSEAYGLPTNGWGVFIPYEKRVSGYESFNTFQPTFLYESICDILILFVLFLVFKYTKKRFDGLIFALYLILYSIVRFFIEAIRIDSAMDIYNIHIAQIVCILIITLSLIFISRRIEKI